MFLQDTIFFNIYLFCLYSLNTVTTESLEEAKYLAVAI